jgi:hypothetical protein
MSNNKTMAHKVDFKKVTIAGFETSPLAARLAGLRAHEARYFMNKYQLDFFAEPASKNQDTLNWVNKILKEERDIEISAKPLEIANVQLENLKWVFVFYENGLAINIPYTIDNTKQRAVGFKLCEGMEIPKELESKFKFARQKSKLAGTIRGSFFVIKGAY